MLVACALSRCAERRTEIANFVVNRNATFFHCRRWLRESSDEAKFVSPVCYSTNSLPRLFPGRGIAVLVKKNTFNCVTFSTKPHFDHSSF